MRISSATDSIFVLAVDRPTWKYDTENEWWDGDDGGKSGHTGKPLDHPEADRALRLGFKPIRESWHASSGPPQFIFPRMTDWLHGIKGEDGWHTQEHPTFSAALDAHERGDHKHYPRLPDMFQNVGLYD